MKCETFKHSLQDQKPGEPECLLFLPHGVEVRDSSEGVTGRKPDQATAAAPTTATGVGPCNLCQDRQETDKEAPGGQSPAGAEWKRLPGVERHCPLQAQLQLRTQTPNTGLLGHTL